MAMVKECRNSHQTWGAKVAGALPSIVLDVSSINKSGRIFLSTPDPRTRGDYVALSYCLSGPQEVLTTKKNRIEHEQSGIELARLPGTIENAAVQVVDTLGIQFLWVDALCIVQDDDATKVLGMEKMGDIYAKRHQDRKSTR